MNLHFLAFLILSQPIPHQFPIDQTNNRLNNPGTKNSLALRAWEKGNILGDPDSEFSTLIEFLSNTSSWRTNPKSLKRLVVLGLLQGKNKLVLKRLHKFSARSLFDYKLQELLESDSTSSSRSHINSLRKKILQEAQKNAPKYSTLLNNHLILLFTKEALRLSTTFDTQWVALLKQTRPKTPPSRKGTFFQLLTQLRNARLSKNRKRYLALLKKLRIYQENFNQTQSRTQNISSFLSNLEKRLLLKKEHSRLKKNPKLYQKTKKRLMLFQRFMESIQSLSKPKISIPKDHSIEMFFGGAIVALEELQATLLKRGFFKEAISLEAHMKTIEKLMKKGEYQTAMLALRATFRTPIFRFFLRIK
ncbi:MAG TPA: hypothetical protein ENK02_10090 [Planctomycetes bacterium]|nr:hypothetical protein [Planctomycetota bacterium]